MSFNTLAAQNMDQELASRVDACAQQEARENAAVHDTQTAVAIRAGQPAAAIFMWDVCMATEAEYASALAANHAHPGKDEAVIGDGAILGAIQASWPVDPDPAP